MMVSCWGIDLPGNVQSYEMVDFKRGMIPSLGILLEGPKLMSCGALSVKACLVDHCLSQIYPPRIWQIANRNGMTNKTPWVMIFFLLSVARLSVARHTQKTRSPGESW